MNDLANTNWLAEIIKAGPFWAMLLLFWRWGPKIGSTCIEVGKWIAEQNELRIREQRADRHAVAGMASTVIGWTREGLQVVIDQVHAMRVDLARQGVQQTAKPRLPPIPPPPPPPSDEEPTL